MAGHDTTSHTLAWIIIAVTNHPEVLSKLKAELHRVVKKDVRITQQQLNDLTYLDYVIKEGMRVWPVTAMGTVRVASRDIQHDKYTIPKGSLLQFPSYAIFRAGIKVTVLLTANYGQLSLFFIVFLSLPPSPCPSPLLSPFWALPKALDPEFANPPPPFYPFSLSPPSYSSLPFPLSSVSPTSPYFPFFS